jgi:hypothetical protein
MQGAVNTRGSGGMLPLGKCANLRISCTFRHGVGEFEPQTKLGPTCDFRVPGEGVATCMYLRFSNVYGEASEKKTEYDCVCSTVAA